MVGRFRQALMASPARYHCLMCGGPLVVFHLCATCFQPVHPACAAACHPLPVWSEPLPGVSNVVEAIPEEDWRVDELRCHFEAWGFVGMTDEGLRSLARELWPDMREEQWF